jgi:hypothetical protein
MITALTFLKSIMPRSFLFISYIYIYLYNSITIKTTLRSIHNYFIYIYILVYVSFDQINRMAPAIWLGNERGRRHHHHTINAWHYTKFPCPKEKAGWFAFFSLVTIHNVITMICRPSESDDDNNDSWWN